MADCALCVVPAIVAHETIAYVLENTIVNKTLYKSYAKINPPEISQADLRTNLNFTPGFRLRYDNKSAIECLWHKEAWSKFLKEGAPHAIVFNNNNDADNTQLSIYLENLNPPKDWDILIFSSSEYIINKRAAKILFYSAKQFDKPIKDYITSFSVLKTINAKEA
jgi:hypothetical protein